MPFLAELKRRKVIRTALAYLVVGWLVLQVADVLVPALNLPGWVLRLIMLLLLLGFPLALVLSWIVEPAPGSGDPLAALAASPALQRQTAPSAAETTVGPVAANLTGSAVMRQPSIAVLPFADMSQARDQEYFADGLADELLNLLARVTDLRVIARTSSFAFKGRGVKVSDIAAELDVTHVLEGSVRKANDQVRITTQLIRASDSSHVWSQSYDRGLSDIFAVQGEIAQAVVAELRASLLPVAALPAGRAAALPAHGRATADTREAGPYDLYLQGRFLESRRTGDGYAGAIACLRRSVDLDPAFAPAWSALGWAYVRQADHGYVPTQAGFESGREAVQRALALDAGQPEPYTALGWIHLAYDWDWAAAWDALRRALEIDPVNAEALMARGVLEYTLARHDDAPQSFLASLSRDPLRATTYHFIGRNHTNSGRFPQAEAAFRRELELDPGRGAAHFFLGRVLLYQGRLVEAQREMELERDLGWGLFGQAMCLHTAGDDGGSLRALDEARTRFGDVSAYQLGEVHAWRGETDQAFEWLELAFQRRDGGLVDIVGAPSVRSLVADPRYSDLLRRLRLPG